MSIFTKFQADTQNSPPHPSLCVVDTFASSSSSVLAKETTITLPLSVLPGNASDAFFKNATNQAKASSTVSEIEASSMQHLNVI